MGVFWAGQTEIFRPARGLIRTGWAIFERLTFLYPVAMKNLSSLLLLVGLLAVAPVAPAPAQKFHKAGRVNNYSLIKHENPNQHVRFREREKEKPKKRRK